MTSSNIECMDELIMNPNHHNIDLPKGYLVFKLNCTGDPKTDFTNTRKSR